MKSKYSDSVSNLAIKLQTRYLRMGYQGVSVQVRSYDLSH